MERHAGLPPQPREPQPPADLSPEAAEIWNQIVAALPAGFFNQKNEFALRALVAIAVADQATKEPPR